jgi:DNA-damage-inducible protein J
VAHEKALPFEMHVPNKITAETLARSEQGEDLHQAENAEEMFRDLGI